MELPEAIHSQVKALCAEGDAHAEQASYDEAVCKYAVALELLPEPITQWEAATWILTAIGDARFLQKRYDEAIQPLLDAMKCPGAIGSPFVHLRLGQVQFELGNEVLAKDELARAYMGGGKKLFQTEDLKYWEVVTSALKRPPGGW
jgi:tetratricopeptide (TPR) repeat protein